MTTLTVDSLRSEDAERHGPSHAPAVVLALVCFAFVVMSTVIAVRTPAWESADEPGHVQNIETLVGGHWYRIGPNAGDEAHQPPLYYALLAGWQHVVGKPARTVDPGPMTLADLGRRGLFAHHSSADHSFLRWLRLPNVLLGLGTILLTALAMREVTTDPWTPVVAAAVVAMTPRFVFLSAFVTNDNLATFLGALLALFALRFALKPSGWRMVPLGVTIGLLIATKLSALPLAAVVLVLLWLTRSWLERARLLLIAVASALAVSLWYLIHNYNWYGDPLARHASTEYLRKNGGLGTFFGQPYHVRDPLALIVQHVPSNILFGFWYKGGWDQFFWSRPAYLLLWALLAVSLVGLIGSRVSQRALATLGVLVLAAFASVWIVAFKPRRTKRGSRLLASRLSEDSPRSER